MEPLSQPKLEVDEREERGDFDQRADDPGDRFAGRDAEHPDRDGDR